MKQPDGSEVIGWVERLVSWTGGLAGLGTAIAALLLAVWRNGYRAGKEAERNRRRDELLERYAP